MRDTLSYKGTAAMVRPHVKTQLKQAKEGASSAGLARYIASKGNTLLAKQSQKHMKERHSKGSKGGGGVRGY